MPTKIQSSLKWSAAQPTDRRTLCTSARLDCYCPRSVSTATSMAFRAIRTDGVSFGQCWPDAARLRRSSRGQVRLDELGNEDQRFDRACRFWNMNAACGGRAHKPEKMGSDRWVPHPSRGGTERGWLGRTVNLPHAELFGLHSWQLRFGDKLKSVATSEGPFGVDAKGKRNVLYVVAVASNGTSQPAQMAVKLIYAGSCFCRTAGFHGVL